VPLRRFVAIALTAGPTRRFAQSGYERDGNHGLRGEQVQELVPVERQHDSVLLRLRVLDVRSDDRAVATGYFDVNVVCVVAQEGWVVGAKVGGA
jgi:hypothetical protein